MMETQAKVLEVEAGAALVEPMEPSGCSACGSNGGGCGADRIGQVFTLRSKRYRVLDPRGSRVGEAVVIGVADGAVLRGSGAVYMLPLLLIFIGAMLAGQFAPPASRDGWSIAGAAIGFALGTLWLLWFSRRAARDARFQPVILRAVSENLFVLKEL
ncbi:MAG TPA: SoxR reducing system RseC family protein [Sulfuriferula sp.]|nr:SoxR reducing system RseC family protein [Sulfuriferula sp.]